MKQSGRQQIQAPRQLVWQTLNDTEVLKRCINGCESFERTAEGAFNAKVRARIGPVNALFGAKVSLAEEPPPDEKSQRFRLAVELQRAPAGFGKGEAQVTLVDAPGQATLLSYELEATVGGKLAQIGSRLIESATSAMASAFFTELEASLTGKETANRAARSNAPTKWLLLAAGGAILAILWLALL